MQRVVAICFDLDNTLWDVWPVIVRAEQEMYAFLSMHYPRVAAKYSIEALRVERERVARDEPNMQHDFTYLRKASLRHCALTVGYDESVSERAFEIFIRARNTVTLYQDVRQALPGLHARYRLFALTNGNADLNAIGLSPFFEAHFAARDVGALKPDPSAFRHMLDKAKLDPHQVLFVGDDPVADVQGARNIGMHSVWMNRTQAVWSTEHGAPPTTITRLTDLLPLLSVKG